MFERQLQERRAVGAGRAVIGGRGDRLLRGVVGVDAPHGVFGQVRHLDGCGRDVEQVGGEGLDVAFGNPRRAEIGVDVAGQHVLRLHVSQGLGVAGEGGAGGFRRGELGPHVAGEVGVGRLPGLRFRVGVDQVAQLGDDRVLGLAVERADERQIDRAALVEGGEQPFLGAGDRA